MVDAEFHLCSCQLGRLHDVSQPTTPSCPTVVAVGTFQSAHGKASMRECLRLSDICSRAGCPSMRTIFLLDYDDVDCAAQCGRIYRVPALGDDAGDRAHILHGFCSRPRPSSLAGGSDSSSWTELSVPEIERIVRPLQVAIASSPRQKTCRTTCRTTWRGISWWSKRGGRSWDGNHSQCMRPAAGMPHHHHRGMPDLFGPTLPRKGNCPHASRHLIRCLPTTPHPIAVDCIHHPHSLSQLSRQCRPWRRLLVFPFPAMLPESQHALYWAPDVARYNMEMLVFLSSGWLKTACVLSALFWYGLAQMRSM
jgi:hypothetical protein